MRSPPNVYVYADFIMLSNKTLPDFDVNHGNNFILDQFYINMYLFFENFK